MTNKTLFNNEYNSKITELKLIIDKVFLVNYKKQTSSFLVYDPVNKTKKYVFKFCGKLASDIEKKRFSQEINFYKKKTNFNCVTPSFIKSGSNFLLIEYIPSKTLREYFFSEIKKYTEENEHKEFKRWLNYNLTITLENYHGVGKSDKNHQSFLSHEQAVNKIFNLTIKFFFSGPFKTKRSFISLLVSKFLFLSSKAYIKKNIDSIFRKNMFLLKKGFIHGDLHLDNILISHNENKIIIIDFSNSKEDDLMIFDLVYLFTTSLTYFEDNKDLKNFLIKRIHRISSRKDFFWIKEVLNISLFMNQIAKTNSRFNRSSFLSVSKSSIMFYLNLYSNKLLN